MSCASKRLALGCVAGLAAWLLVAGCRRERACTVEDQCPKVGDACSYFTSDKAPLCLRTMEKSGLALRCEVESVGARRTAVFCPPDAK